MEAEEALPAAEAEAHRAEARVCLEKTPLRTIPLRTRNQKTRQKKETPVGWGGFPYPGKAQTSDAPCRHTRHRDWHQNNYPCRSACRCACAPGEDFGGVPAAHVRPRQQALPQHQPPAHGIAMPISAYTAIRPKIEKQVTMTATVPLCHQNASALIPCLYAKYFCALHTQPNAKSVTQNHISQTPVKA